MTVTLKGEIPGDRKATNSQGQRTYTRAFRLESDDKTDGPFTVGSTSGLPLIGTAHPEDSSAYCTELQVDNDEPWQGWKVTANYSDARELHPTDPAQDEIKVSWDGEIYQESIIEDVDGDAIVNSAGDYFIDPVPTREASHLIAKIRLSVIAVPSWVISYQNAVNNAAITIGGLAIDAGLAKVQRISVGEKEYRNGVGFYPFSYEVHIHKDGWRFRPLDAGFREIVDGELVQIKDSNNDEPTTPVPLDGSGAPLALPTPATAVIGNYQIYPELDLSQLPGIT